MYLHILSYTFIYILVLPYSFILTFSCTILSYDFHILCFSYTVLSYAFHILYLSYTFVSLTLYFLYLYTCHTIIAYQCYTSHIMLYLLYLSCACLGFLFANTLEADTGNNCMYLKVLSLYETMISIYIYLKVSSLYETVTYAM